MPTKTVVSVRFFMHMDQKRGQQQALRMQQKFLTELGTEDNTVVYRSLLECLIFFSSA